MERKRFLPPSRIERHERLAPEDKSEHKEASEADLNESAVEEYKESSSESSRASESLALDSRESDSTNNQLECVECSQKYTFSEEQQKEYAAKGYQTPKRCPQCRQNRRKRNNDHPRKSKKGRMNRRRFNPSFSQNSSSSNLQPAQGSYVAQAEYYKNHKSIPEVSPSKAEGSGENEDFGNSIHYNGPGVDPRFGTARVGSPQYAPWEGAHGFLLTSHEPGLKNRNQKEKNKGRQQRGVKNNRRSDSGKSFKSRNRNHKGKRRTFEIVCMECGITTQVPFKPIPGKPVFCQECYKKSKSKNTDKSLANTPEGTEIPPSSASGETSEV